MYSTWFLPIVSVLLVSVVSLIGVFTLSYTTERLRRMLFLLVSFAAGALLGDVFIHLLPEIVEEQGFTLSTSIAIFSGICLMFVVEKIIHWRHCHYPSESGEHLHPFAIMNLVGDAVHNLIDGLIIGASYLVSVPVGIATTIAVVLHEIPQEIGDFGVLIHGGFSKKKALFYNFVIALTSLLGVVVTLFVAGFVDHTTRFLIPFAAGGFIYIAGSDLIPELHKEVGVKRSVGQFVALILGFIVMMALLVLE